MAETHVKYHYFLVFPEVLFTLRGEFPKYKIVVTKKNDQRVIGKGSPYFHLYGELEYHELDVGLFTDTEITIDQLDWKVVDSKGNPIANVEMVIRKMPYLSEKHRITSVYKTADE